MGIAKVVALRLLEIYELNLRAGGGTPPAFILPTRMPAFSASVPLVERDC